jgi:hypothetical protein
MTARPAQDPQTDTPPPEPRPLLRPDWPFDCDSCCEIHCLWEEKERCPRCRVAAGLDEVLGLDARAGETDRDDWFLRECFRDRLLDWDQPVETLLERDRPFQILLEWLNHRGLPAVRRARGPLPLLRIVAMLPPAVVEALAESFRDDLRGAAEDWQGWEEAEELLASGLPGTEKILPPRPNPDEEGLW